jgi:branched-chain amino acid transport system permease protein
MALLVGFPCLKVKGPYLALVTMAFPIILKGVIDYSTPITGGEMGIGVPTFFPFPAALFDLRVLSEYYLTLILLAVSAMIIYKIANSKTGIVFVSILDNELASKASGINVTKYKLMAFAISGLFGSLAGAVYAHKVTVVNPPGTLSLTISFLPVILTILGGLGTIYGPLVGAYIYYILDGYVFKNLIRLPTQWEIHIVTAFLPEIRFPIYTDYILYLVFTIIVVLLVIKWPRGIARLVVDKLKDLEEAREIEERGKKHRWNVRRLFDKLKALSKRPAQKSAAQRAENASA